MNLRAYLNKFLLHFQGIYEKVQSGCEMMENDSKMIVIGLLTLMAQMDSRILHVIVGLHDLMASCHVID